MTTPPSDAVREAAERVVNFWNSITASWSNPTGLERDSIIVAAAYLALPKPSESDKARAREIADDVAHDWIHDWAGMEADGESHLVDAIAAALLAALAAKEAEVRLRIAQEMEATAQVRV